jgi:uncharacterized protein
MDTTALSTTDRPDPGRVGERDVPLPQYSRRQVLAVWAAVTVPMSVLGWLVAPWWSHHLHTRDPFIDALLICFDVGLAWQVVLVFWLVRREQGSLAWHRVKRALRLWSPRDPRTGRIGGRVWWWVVPFLVGTALLNFLPIDPEGPLPRDFPKAILTDRIAHYYDGNWSGFALTVVVMFLAPIAEELVFRGLLLPRMRAAFTRGDFVVNGVLFTLYHLHQPWSMPATLLDGTINQAYASKRFQSTWMGLITHTAPSFLSFAAVLALFLGG